MNKYTLRSNGNKVVTLPPEIWQEAGWNINDKVEITTCENYNSQDEKWISISIDRTTDLEKWDDSVYPAEKEIEK